MIKEKIATCLANTLLIRNKYPAVTEVRYDIFDIPYDELRQFALENEATLHTSTEKKRAYVIYSPININKQMDTDIWLYSVPVKIKPAEIIAE